MAERVRNRKPSKPFESTPTDEEPPVAARRILLAPPPRRIPTYDAPPVAPSAPPSPARRVPEFSLRIVGFAVVGLSIVGLALNLVLPWTAVELPQQGDQGGFTDSYWHDLAPMAKWDATGYLASQVNWPLYALAAGIAFGVLLVVADGLSPTSARRGWLGLAAGSGLALSGFVLLLGAFRWLGGYFATLWDSGRSNFHLHAAPYLNLTLGVLLLATGLLLVRGALQKLPSGARRRRNGVPAWSLLVLGIGLLALPMLPFAVQKIEEPQPDQNRVTYLGEAQLNGLIMFGLIDFGLISTAHSHEAEHPGEDLLLIRTMVWILFFVGLLAWAGELLQSADRFASVGRALSQLYALAIVPIGFGIAYTTLLYLQIPDMDKDLPGKVTLGFNYFPPVIFLATLVFYLLHLRSVFPPGRSPTPKASAQAGGGAA